MRTLEVALDGFYDFRIHDPSDAPHPGGDAPETKNAPRLTCKFRMPAPFPDVGFVQVLTGDGKQRWWLAGRPMDNASIKRWLRADPIAATSLTVQWGAAIHNLLQQDTPVVVGSLN